MPDNEQGTEINEKEYDEVPSLMQLVVKYKTCKQIQS